MKNNAAKEKLGQRMTGLGKKIFSRGIAGEKRRTFVAAAGERKAGKAVQKLAEAAA